MAMTESDPMPGGHSQPNVSEAYPFYIVCDVSSSMHDAANFKDEWGEGSETSPWLRITAEVNAMFTELQEDVQIRQTARLAVVEFSGEAILRRALSDLRNNAAPNFAKGSWTNFVDVWKLLAELIPGDTKAMQSKGIQVRRPTIFFITDGQPGRKGWTQQPSDWNPYVNQLNDKMGSILAPRVVAIGLGAVRRDTLLELHSKNPHGAAVIAKASESTKELVKPLVTQITKSIGNTTISGRFSWTPPKGMENLCNKDKH